MSCVELERVLPEDTPKFTADMVLFRALAGGIITAAGRKLGGAILRETTAIMADEEAAAAVVSIRSSKRTREVARAQLEAAEMYRRVRPILEASVRRR